MIRIIKGTSINVPTLNLCARNTNAVLPYLAETYATIPNLIDLPSPRAKTKGISPTDVTPDRMANALSGIGVNAAINNAKNPY